MLARWRFGVGRIFKPNQSTVLSGGPVGFQERLWQILLLSIRAGGFSRKVLSSRHEMCPETHKCCGFSFHEWQKSYCNNK